MNEGEFLCIEIKKLIQIETFIIETRYLKIKSHIVCFLDIIRYETCVLPVQILTVVQWLVLRDFYRYYTVGIPFPSEGLFVSPTSFLDLKLLAGGPLNSRRLESYKII